MADARAKITPPPVDRLAASRAAVAARRARAAVKAALAHGVRSALDVLDVASSDPASVEGRIRVTELLKSVPAIGEQKMHAALRSLEISTSKRLGGLGRRQRIVLREYLAGREALNRARRSSSLVVLAGPTAVGKGTVAGHIRAEYPDVLLSVSATTRMPRPGEVDGVNYFFVDDAEFDRMIRDGELLEWARVHNAYLYGTPRKPVEAALALGKSVLLEIDLQGARSIRAVMPDAVLIFLAPPSWEELVRRLVGRDTEDSAEQQRRLATAKVELAAESEFDHLVVNDDVAEAARQVVDLMQVRSARTPAAVSRAADGSR